MRKRPNIKGEYVQRGIQKDCTDQINRTDSTPDKLFSSDRDYTSGFLSNPRSFSVLQSLHCKIITYKYCNYEKTVVSLQRNSNSIQTTGVARHF